MIIFDTEDNSAELRAAGKSGFDKQVTQIAGLAPLGKRFYNTGLPLDFIKWCHQTGETDVWAFNTPYDIGNLCHANEGKLRLWDFDQTLVKGRFIKGKVQGLNFYDVHNLSGNGSSVASIGLAVGLPKFGHNYSEKDFVTFPKSEQVKFLKFKSMSKAELFRNPEYVFRDCEIPRRWLEFVKENCIELGIESVPATLGSLCVKTYKALGHENWFDSSDEAHSALTGARVELFSGGGAGNIAYTDINSLYPWCMTQLFPTHIEKLTELKGFGIAEVDIEVPEMMVAPLPIKDDNGRLLFPIGKFTGVWTIHEILNAVSCGAKVLKVKWILGSPGGKAYYRDYITTMYARRMSAKSPAENLFWKLLMNNLYGRLAIGGVISRTLMLTEENQHDGIPFGQKILADHQMPLPEFSNYLHAAYVLSYARIRLNQFLRKVNPENLIYCDTDSIFFFNQGDNLPFPISKELGEMKLEKFASYAQPYLPKMYRFGDDYKAKGVPKKLAQVFIETGRAEYDLPFKMREAIRFYDRDNSHKLSVWRQVEKIRAATYDRKQIKGKFFLPKKVNMIN